MLYTASTETHMRLIICCKSFTKKEDMIYECLFQIVSNMGIPNLPISG